MFQPNETPSALGVLLRQWRPVRGWSQQDLARVAGVSSRHLSFVETGRARASRKLVLRLAECLGVPLRERNAFLEAAGFATIYYESGLDDPELMPVRTALEAILARHEPHPAFVLDTSWNLVMANEAQHRLLPMLLQPGIAPPDPLNVMQLILHPAWIRSSIRNWQDVAHADGHRLRRRLAEIPRDHEDAAMFEEFLGYTGVAEAMARLEPAEAANAMVPLEVVVGERVLSWFRTTTTIDAPLDVTIDELRIESLFPADQITERLARELLSGTTPEYPY